MIMQKFSEFYNTIDDIIRHCRTDFIGPVEEEEVIEIEDPLSRYTIGILWAQPKEKNSETIEISNALEEAFEENSEDNEDVRNLNIFKPSYMGLSFTVSGQDKLNVSFSYAVYHHFERQMKKKKRKNYPTALLFP